jgi:hypothetical protein
VPAAREGRDDESNRLSLADDNRLDVREKALRDRRSGLEGARGRGHLARPARVHPQPPTQGFIEAS